jgi:hypothetical protein
MSHVGIAVGGPADGKEISSVTEKVFVPVLIPGEAGFGQAVYRWHNGNWLYQSARPN